MTTSSVIHMVPHMPTGSLYRECYYEYCFTL